MTLYEYLKMTENDYDTYDTEYDAEVTVCYIEDDEDDEYDKFCNGIIKKVNVVKINGDILIVDWCKLIKRNMDEFRKFSAENWRTDCQYEDDEDEFIYQWINEIHMYMAGCVGESFYSKLTKLIDSLV